LRLSVRHLFAVEARLSEGFVQIRIALRRAWRLSRPAAGFATVTGSGGVNDRARRADRETGSVLEVRVC